MKQLIWIISVVALLALTGCPKKNPSAVVPPAPLSPEAQISEGKVQVEARVKLLKTYYKTGDEEYTKSRDLYFDAQAAYAAWITDLGNALVQQKDANNLASQSHAQSASKAFIDYAKKAIAAKEKSNESQVRSLVSVSNVSLTPWDALSKFIIDAGIAVWQQYQAARVEKRQEEVAFYDSIKWSEWDQIGSTARPNPSATPASTPPAP